MTQARSVTATFALQTSPPPPPRNLRVLRGGL
jgi:hypothetical protein